MKVVLGAVVVLVLMIGAQSAFALTEYQLGFKRGVSDADTPSVQQWYILRIGNGFASHSKEFVRGYVNGFCSIQPTTSNDDDQATWDCKKGPDSARSVSEQTIRTEYQLGFKRGVYDTTSNTPLKVANDVIVEHGHAFYQGWLDGNCGYNQTAGGSDADEFTFDCSDANSSPPALTR